MTRAVQPFLFACSIQMAHAEEFIWNGSVAERAIYATICLTFGFVAIRHPDWLVRQALLIARKYPRLSASLLSERSWCPEILRGLGAILLICGSIFAATIMLRVWWVLNLHV
jgi:hypothetical protein